MYAVLFNALIDYLAETLLIDKEFNLKIECVFGITSVDNPRSCGMGLLNMILPRVVGTSLVTFSPFISLVIRILILE